MKKIFCLVFALLLAAVAGYAATYRMYAAVSLTGGVDGSLDNKDGSSLNDGDAALVLTATTAYFYTLDADSGAAEDSPGIIAPDLNAGTKRWLLINSYDLTVHESIYPHANYTTAADPITADTIVCGGDGAQGVKECDGATVPAPSIDANPSLSVQGSATQTGNELQVLYPSARKVFFVANTGAGFMQLLSDNASGGAGIEWLAAGSGPQVTFGSAVDTDAYAKYGAYDGVWNFQANGRDLNFRSDTLSSIILAEHDTGNVGIGISSPTEELDIVTNSHTGLRVHSTSATSNPEWVLSNGTIKYNSQIIGSGDQSWRFRDVTNTLNIWQYIPLTSLGFLDGLVVINASGNVSADSFTQNGNPVVDTSTEKDRTYQQTTRKSAAYTVGTDDADECYGGIIYVESAATVTACDDLSDGMNFTVITIGDIAVSLDVQGDNYMYLDGAVGGLGEAATNLSDSGDLIKCNYFDATHWYCTSGSLTSPGVWSLP